MATEVKDGRRKARRKFVDRARIQVVGGQGGRGVVSFENLGMGHKMRATGGHGGHGGNVVIEATRHIDGLSFQTYVITAPAGQDATGSGKHGRAGKDIRVFVPCGTVVKEVFRERLAPLPADVWQNPWGVDDVDGSGAANDGDDAQDLLDEPMLWDEESFEAALASQQEFTDRLEVLADLDVHGQQFVAARGGEPGMGNRSMPRWEQKPDTPHIVGMAGERRFLELELKLIADVGLVGFPNAGKSTLLGAISRAKPAVADYPFTTLHPTVGHLHFADEFRMTVADIPGLIEGAHENRGLGHEFLRHIERTKVLLYVIDVSPTAVLPPAEQLHTLQNELDMYNPEVRASPAAVVASKVDTPGCQANVAALREATLLPVMEISSTERRNLDLLVSSLRWLVESALR